MVSICTYPRCSIAAAVAAGPSPNGASTSSRWARNQIARAAFFVKAVGSSERGITRQFNGIRAFRQSFRPESAASSGLGAVADAAGRDLRIANGLAAFRGLAPVDAAGEAVDQPHIVVERAVHADEARPDRRNQ